MKPTHAEAMEALERLGTHAWADDFGNGYEIRRDIATIRARLRDNVQPDHEAVRKAHEAVRRLTPSKPKPFYHKADRVRDADAIRAALPPMPKEE